jgi:hypothetical protein
MSSNDWDNKNLRKHKRFVGHICDDPVGFKNPPRSFQFRKGESGNPKGRPKGSKNKPRFGNGELMASVFNSAIRDLSHRFDAKIREYQRANSPTIQAQRRRRGLPPLVAYPKPEDYRILPDGFQMEVFGPMSPEEDIQWKELLKLEKQYRADRAELRRLFKECQDGDDAKRQLKEAVDKLDQFLKQTLDEKEKFRRTTFTPEVQRSFSKFIAEEKARKQRKP